jgi:thiamine biosynthesis lipoprotein ApbE
MRAVAALVALMVSAACGAAGRSPSHVVERAGAAMGSDLRLTAWTSDDAAAGAAFDGVLREFDRLDALMSVWRPGSDVLRINDAAGVRAVAVSADVREVLHVAQQVSEWTGGRFDVTFGPLADLWKFDRQNADRPFRRPRTSARGCRWSTTAGSRSTIAPAPCFCDVLACACTLAASAKATRSGERRRSCAVPAFAIS